MSRSVSRSKGAQTKTAAEQGAAAVGKPRRALKSYMRDQLWLRQIRPPSTQPLILSDDPASVAFPL